MGTGHERACRRVRVPEPVFTGPRRRASVTSNGKVLQRLLKAVDSVGLIIESAARVSSHKMK
jgi:hypothetical protein